MIITKKGKQNQTMPKMKTSCRQKAIANKPAFPQCLTICLCATLLCLVHNAVFAIDCPTCGAIDLPGLAMFCHECNADLHDPSLKIEQRQDSSLRIRLLYTGDHPDRIPPYGKLYVNGKYAGNIDMTEKEERDEDFVASWNEGLGREYTAIYEKNFNKIPSGVLKIEVEMKFDRLYGFGRSYKRVVFPYISFKGGEKTTIDHYFNGAATFNQYRPGKKKPIPVISDTKLQGASGTVAINIGLFK